MQPVLSLANEVLQGRLNECTDKNGENFYFKYNQLVDILKPVCTLPYEKPETASRTLLGLFKSSKKSVTQEFIPSFLSIEDSRIRFEEIQSNIEASNFISKAQSEFSQVKSFLSKTKEKPYNLEIKIKVDNLMINYLSFMTLVDNIKDSILHEDKYFLENNLGSYVLESLKVYDKAVSRYDVILKAQDNANFKKLFSNSVDPEVFKEKIDNECLRQLSLLEKQLEMVKSNVIQDITQSSLTDTQVKTRYYTKKFG